MSKVQLLNIFTLFIFLLSCKKETNESEGLENDANSINVKTSYSYNINKNSSLDTIPVIYYGDTLKVTAKLKSDQLVQSVKMYYLDENGYKSELDDYSMQNKSYTKTIQSKDTSFTFLYSFNYNERDINNFTYMFNESENIVQEPKIIFEYYDSKVLIKKDTLPAFKLKKLDFAQHIRLFNVALDFEEVYNNGLYYTQYFYFTGSELSYGNSRNINDSTVLIVNVPNDSYYAQNESERNKTFINGWFSPNENVNFSKVTGKYPFLINGAPLDVHFDHVHTTWHILDLHGLSSNGMNKILEPNIGDLYTFKIQNVYGIIEVVHIQDDGITATEGGSDYDYIEIRIKSFLDENRFK